jgi:acylphosphatase
MAASKSQRVTVCYSGHVQGVGFRYTANSIARGHDVTGYVRNLPDGRVESVAEGDPRATDAFLGEVSERLGDHIRDERRDTSPATGEFAGFEIRH